MESVSRGKPRTSKGQVFWKNHIHQWQQSGESKVAYCRAHGLSQSTFDNWRRKLQPGADRKQSKDFISLRLRGNSAEPGLDPSSAKESPIEIQLAKDIVIKVNPPIDADALFQVLRLVRQLP